MERQLLRFGASFAFVGVLIYAVAGGMHQDLPGRELGMEAVLHHAAERPWPAIHMASMIAVVLWLGAFVTLTKTLRGPVADLLGPLLVAAATVGTAVQIVDFAIDGWVLAALAERWGAAPEVERATLLLVTWTVHRIMAATVLVAVIFMTGLPFLLAGLALVKEPGYPPWFGGIGAVVGAAALVGGTLRFAGAEFVPTLLLFVGFGVTDLLWLLALSWLMWRRASAIGEWGAEPRTSSAPAS